MKRKDNSIKRNEDEQDIREARRILAEVKSGRQKTYSKREFERITGARI